MTEQSSVQLNRVRDDIAARMRADMRNTIEQHLGYDETAAVFLEALVTDGMHPVEHLLVDNDQLVEKLAESLNETARLKGGRMR